MTDEPHSWEDVKRIRRLEDEARRLRERTAELLAALELRVRECDTCFAMRKLAARTCALCQRSEALIFRVRESWRADLASWSWEEREAWAERAAILEFMDEVHPREEAERRAYEQMLEARDRER